MSETDLKVSVSNFYVLRSSGLAFRNMPLYELGLARDLGLYKKTIVSPPRKVSNLLLTCATKWCKFAARFCIFNFLHISARIFKAYFSSQICVFPHLFLDQKITGKHEFSAC